jgi:transposase InsO family protein
MLQPDMVWPAASTFGNILSRAGITSPQRKRKRTTPCSEPFSLVTGTNQLWCMDFKGYFTTGDGKRCDPFTITDAYSRYLIRCQIVSRMDLSQVRAICEAAMREYGIPARIRTDSGDISWHKRRAFISEVFRFEELACELITPGFIGSSSET